MDRSRVKAQAAHIRNPASNELATREQLDEAVETLIHQLHEIADFSTPKAKQNKGRKASWWDYETKKAVQEMRQAGRNWRAARTQHNSEEYEEARKTAKKTIRSAKRKQWRGLLASVSEDPKLLWRLERWARLKSHAPREQPKLPDLKRGEGAAPARSHAEKAEALSAKFFPDQPADLSDIKDTGFEDGSFHGGFELRQSITEEDITAALQKTKPWKAPGEDLIPTGFLKACGQPLREALASIATASLQLEYYPTRFKRAIVVVLRKPGKTVIQQQEAGGWRPISLLSTIGKVIEAAIGTRVAEAAEKQLLLPELQMGNRKERSTELAVRLVAEIVRTAWAKGAIASLVQLDITGAYDTVNHLRLLDTLRSMGFPPWIVRWISGFLAERKARLRFDGEDTPPIEVKAGVPQGSPLSPILFILYTASLYKELATYAGLTSVGFSDDLNLLATGKTVEPTRRILETAWLVCQRWAEKRGADFNPLKTELMHFTRKRAAIEQRVHIAGVDVKPKPVCRFLGVWLDRKLRWSGHLEHMQKKLQTQQFALIRLAASTWGCNLARAREVYTKVIRSALAYGAATYYTPIGNDKPTFITSSLRATRAKYLRIVAGAYRATPIRHLETETHVPPIDIYLNKRVAEFEKRLEATGKAQLIRNACARVRAQIRKGPGRPRKQQPDEPNSGQAKATWARQWTKDRSTDEAMEDEWKERWLSNSQAARQRPILEAADDNPDFKATTLNKHVDLRKHESSALIQIRTGRIGLRAFLFQQGVPDVLTPHCSCGQAAQIPRHLFLDCPNTRDQRDALPTIRTLRDLYRYLRGPEQAGRLARWLLRLGLLRQFDLATILTNEERKAEWRKGPRKAARKRRGRK
jgi:hypothetical protein